MYLLTPMDIHDHQFKKSFRGYSENEVDDFLDRVVADFEKLLRDNDRLKNQINTDAKELEKYRSLEKTMNDTLMVAQRTADEVISNARKTVDDMKEQAARECQQIREQAQYEAKQTIDNANLQREAILAEYAKLVSEKQSFMLKFRTMLEAELALTVQVLESLPKVDEAAKRPLPEVKPVEETAPPVKEIEPERKIPAPVEEDTGELNIVDVSTKPVVDGTRTYKPVKPVQSLGKGAAK